MSEKRARRTEIPNLPKQEDPTDGYRAIRDFLISEFPVEDLDPNKTTSEIVIALLSELLGDTQ